MNRRTQSAEEDSFGLVGIASTGAILAVLILGLFVRSDEPLSGSIPASAATVTNWLAPFLHELPKIAGEILLAVSPILIIFALNHVFFADEKLSKCAFRRIFLGMAYLFVGLVLFLTGVNAGFMEVGRKLGMLIAGDGQLDSGPACRFCAGSIGHFGGTCRICIDASNRRLSLIHI